MNRVEIKNEAKAKIKGNIWNLLWPILVISVITGLIGGVFGVYNVTDKDTISVTGSIGSCLSTFVATFLSAGYIKYVIDFVRTGKFDTNVIFSTIKEKWLNILIASVLVDLIVGVGIALLVVPGIIAALGLSFVSYLVVDKDVSGSDSIKESWNLMKGYKWDYFVFGLSFLGWMLLLPLTLGILSIWLIPYMCVACVLYYDKLVEKRK